MKVTRRVGTHRGYPRASSLGHVLRRAPDIVRVVTIPYVSGKPSQVEILISIEGKGRRLRSPVCMLVADIYRRRPGTPVVLTKKNIVPQSIYILSLPIHIDGIPAVYDDIGE
jgi:hypothetical protein